MQDQPFQYTKTTKDTKFDFDMGDSMAKLDSVMQMLQDSNAFSDVFEEELDFGKAGRKISRKYSAYYEDIFDFYDFDEEEDTQAVGRTDTVTYQKKFHRKGYAGSIKRHHFYA